MLLQDETKTTIEMFKFLTAEKLANCWCCYELNPNFGARKRNLQLGLAWMCSSVHSSYIMEPYSTNYWEKKKEASSAHFYHYCYYYKVIWRFTEKKKTMKQKLLFLIILNTFLIYHILLLYCDSHLELIKKGWDLK